METVEIFTQAKAIPVLRHLNRNAIQRSIRGELNKEVATLLDMKEIEGNRYCLRFVSNDPYCLAELVRRSLIPYRLQILETRFVSTV